MISRLATKMTGPSQNSEQWPLQEKRKSGPEMKHTGQMSSGVLGNLMCLSELCCFSFLKNIKRCPTHSQWVNKCAIFLRTETLRRRWVGKDMEKTEWQCSWREVHAPPLQLLQSLDSGPQSPSVPSLRVSFCNQHHPCVHCLAQKLPPAGGNNTALIVKYVHPTGENIKTPGRSGLYL